MGLNYLYYPEEGLFDRLKYWLSLFISLYIFGFLFVVWRWFFFTSLFIIVAIYFATTLPISNVGDLNVKNFWFTPIRSNNAVNDWWLRYRMIAFVAGKRSSLWLLVYRSSCSWQFSNTLDGDGSWMLIVVYVVVLIESSISTFFI